MKSFEINSVVKSVAFVKRDRAGNIEIERMTVDRDEGRQTKGLKPLERMVRKMVKGELAAATVYLERHKRSNQLHKDGWIRDFGKNLGRAVKSARDCSKEPKLTIVRDMSSENL